jgi:hypothetical protein
MFIFSMFCHAAMEKPLLQLGDDNQAVEPMGSFAMLHVENAKCEALSGSMCNREMFCVGAF